METVTTIFVFLLMCGTGPTNPYSKPEIHNHGDNATVLIETISADGTKRLQIFFSGFTQKPHVIHMIIMGPNTSNEDDIQVSRYYSGRIKDIHMNNGRVTFLLLNVNFMDSGNYTVFEGSFEKGKQSIHVTRRILTGQVSKPIILPFMCNNTNTSSIAIDKNHVFDHADYIIYDVARKRCTYTNVSQNLINRIDSCVLNNTKINLILRELTWQDKGVYTAWDDQGLILDSLFVGSPGNSIWLLVTTVVNVLVLACLAIIAVRKLRHKKSSIKSLFRTRGCSKHTTLQSDDDDERKYEESRSNDMELTACLEPFSQPVNVYERLHPYDNQGNNMYRSLRPETII